ncbi:MAG: sensor histidine kinase [Aquabacterium sp.]|uniref:sensor histidine kinase n=1 Tax=Aquabacterium sp. TaxID=1872578 RepID=UPI00271C7BD5|nr:sensor histidine kinase [Aquabacterium sp.]MDO9003019.1 sensor histidine kinase [Aquabacterium sp.]
MRLSNFILANLEPILADWVTFARNEVAAAENLDEEALRDHGKLILQKMAADMHRPQGEDERQAKSEGNSSHVSTSRNLPSRSHARQRERQGFDVEQMVSEYRALRATVLRLWSACSRDAHAEDLEDVIRFNEAVDQAVAESLTAFVAEVSKTRDLFLGVLGHDLRGPLSTIKNCAAVLRVDPKNARSVGMVLRSVAQMKALLDDLMEYTGDRFGAELTVNPAPLQLDGFVRDTLDEISAVNPSCLLELKVQGAMQGEWDSRRLHQALSNLVFNALKYGLPGKPIRVALDGSLPGQMVLTVCNEGQPIPADVLPQIFEPLVRARGKGEEEHGDSLAGANLGLGLYVVRHIAMAHGGSVTVTSDVSATCFELRLPRVSGRR